MIVNFEDPYKIPVTWQNMVRYLRDEAGLRINHPPPRNTIISELDKFCGELILDVKDNVIGIRFKNELYYMFWLLRYS